MQAAGEQVDSKDAVAAVEEKAAKQRIGDQEEASLRKPKTKNGNINILGDNGDDGRETKTRSGDFPANHKNSDRNGGRRNIFLSAVRGCGLFIGIEFEHLIVGKPATAETSLLVLKFLQKHKILTSIDGPNNNVLVIKPPLCFCKEDVDHFMQALQGLLHTWEDGKEDDDAVVSGHGHTPT